MRWRTWLGYGFLIMLPAAVCAGCLVSVTAADGWVIAMIAGATLIVTVIFVLIESVKLQESRRFETGLRQHGVRGVFVLHDVEQLRGSSWSALFGNSRQLAIRFTVEVDGRRIGAPPRMVHEFSATDVQRIVGSPRLACLVIPSAASRIRLFPFADPDDPGVPTSHHVDIDL